MQLDQRNESKPNGFTLVELLVVIGVIAILIAITLPALTGARGSALQTVSLSNVRSVGQQFSQYASVHRQNPHRGYGDIPSELEEMGDMIPGGEDVIIVSWYPGGVVMATSDYFSQAWLWPAIVTPMDEWPEFWETWISPRKQDADLPEQEDFGFDNDTPIEEQISVRYSNSFVARPKYFSEGVGAEESASLLRATRPQDVRYPSGKVMLWDNDLAYMTREVPERVDGLLNADTPMCFADMHGEVLNPQDASDSVTTPLQERSTRLHSTKDGVFGRDY